MAYCSLNFLGSGDPLGSASRELGLQVHTTALLVFRIFVEMEFRSIAQSGLELWAQAVHLPQPPKGLGLQA
uniref:Macaca fascicularis brain cDNA clone: QflA-20148, similar to human KIAA1280 protein (KIAA1280), mRNA, RefSeq: NM_015691.2 n=1 Tax=Macaca fascicularis TaxID=9541 RepID=I7G6G8_MACFA|nr:unnamed protein product [Macaca fascicularis]